MENPQMTIREVAEDFSISVGLFRAKLVEFWPSMNNAQAIIFTRFGPMRLFPLSKTEKTYARLVL